MVAFSKRCPKLAVATLCVALLLGASRAAIPGRRSLLDESMVNEGMNLIPQMNDTEGNDTAGSMTEATNDTIALEELVDNEMTGENISGKRMLPEEEETGNATVGSMTMDDFKGKGAGTCSYTNPFTQSPTCVQMVGSKYENDEAAAREFCDSPGMPGTVGTFEAGASCAAFEDENFGGVCVTGRGTPEEVASTFVEDPTNAMAAMGSCEVTVQGCETFAGGTWYALGGKCRGSQPVAIAEDPDMPDAIRPCCKAANAKCMACAAGVSVEDFCKTNEVVGCDQMGSDAGATEQEDEGVGMEFPQGALNPLTYTGGSQDTFYIPP